MQHIKKLARFFFNGLKKVWHAYLHVICFKRFVFCPCSYITEQNTIANRVTLFCVDG